MGFKEIGREAVDWIHLAQDGDKWWAVIKMALNFLSSLDTKEDSAPWS